MEEAGQPGPDRVASVSNSTPPVAAERRFVPNNSIEKTLPPKDEKVLSANSTDRVIVGPTSIVTNPPEILVSSGVLATSYQPNAYTQPDQSFYYGAYDNSGNWGEYPNYVNGNNLQIIPPAMYNDNPSLFFPSGYGFDTQAAYGQYPPMASPMSPFLVDGQLYSPHQIPMSPNYFPQSISPGLPHVSSSHSMSQNEMVTPVSTGQESLNDNMLFGPGTGYYLHFGSFPASNPPGNNNVGLYKYPGEFGSGENPSIRSNTSDTGNILSPLTPGAVYTQPLGILGSYDNSLAQASQQQTPFTRRYPNNISSRISNYGNWDASRFNQYAPEKGGRRDRDSVSISANSHGISNDRNRGPRALRPKTKISAEDMTAPGIAKAGASTSGVNLDLYNQPDFVTDYERAKFFVIKSFSEDNIHKSIKYQVWASTPLGNRKLDAAYKEAKDASDHCPVFLFFSVNASGQFCGVAEMAGPIDFENDADYWQQDRWSGQFPVRWHIIKDVPNGRFRHILLDNNDNKPVTHSRDSQEVKLELGIAMLKIFKEYDADSSILDDFNYYNGREERSLQEKKAKQPSPSKSPDASMINQLSENLAGTLQLNVSEDK